MLISKEIRFALKLLVVFFLFLVNESTIAQPQNTNISYQGKLDFGGQSANGMFDFRVSLYDAIELGSQIENSNAPMFNDVFVEEGLVNLSINFGVGVFDGGPRFIQIEVREHGSTGNYTILQPRQEVFATPHSVSASSIDGDIIQKGTIGDCLSDGSAGGPTGSVLFESSFSSTPLVFLTANESFNNDGCASVRVISSDVNGFSWRSFVGNMEFPCDCIHWLAIGPPEQTTPQRKAQ